MRPTVLFVSLFLLSACATRPAGPAPQVEQAAPVGPDPRVCAKIPGKPLLDGKAGLVQPLPGTAEADAVSRLLNSASDLSASWDVLAERLGLAQKTVCPKVAR